MDMLKSAYDALSDTRTSCSCSLGEAIRVATGLDAIGHHYVQPVSFPPTANKNQ